MMILRKKAIFFVLLPAILPLLADCSGRIDGKLRQDGSTELGLKINIEPRMTAMLRSLSSLGGASRAPANPNAPVISGSAIARSMAVAPGILSADLANTGPSGIAGTIRASRVNDLFALPGAPERKRFVTLESAGETGNNRLRILLDREIAPLLLAMISPDIRDYLSALFAPAATGDSFSKAEYLDLVGDIYGKALAEELAAASLAVTIDFPGAIGAVQGGTFAGTAANFTIALADILVLETPLEYEVIWK
jgi:hypothetical protein